MSGMRNNFVEDVIRESEEVRRGGLCGGGGLRGWGLGLRGGRGSWVDGMDRVRGTMGGWVTTRRGVEEIASREEQTVEECEPGHGYDDGEGRDEG